MRAKEQIELLLTGSPEKIGRSIYTLPYGERRRITVDLCADAGWECRFTKRRPSYHKDEGWHLLVKVMHGWCHVKGVGDGDEGDWSLLVSWLTRLCCGEWTLYQGRADR